MISWIVWWHQPFPTTLNSAERRVAEPWGNIQIHHYTLRTVLPGYPSFLVKMILSFALSLMITWNRHQHFCLPLGYLKIFILLNFLRLPMTFAQDLYSTCSQACIETQDAVFSIPSGSVYGAVANNQAVCNNKPFLKATAQCIYQNCGEQDSVFPHRNVCSS